MQGSEKLCLRWSDFKENTASVFGKLQNTSEFSDVTLVSEEGEKIEAHKVILAFSSPFFMELLSENKHPHPLIYMRGLKYDVLLALPEFLYFGRTNLVQEKLDEFLSLAAELKLKGLVRDEEQDNKGSSSKPKTSHMKLVKENPISEAVSSIETSIQTQLDTHTNANTKVEQAQNENNENLEAQIRSMISSSDESLRSAGMSGKGMVHTCKVCGKRGENSNIRRHIESIHIAGVAQVCNICGQIASSRIRLQRHIYENHKEQVCKGQKYS